MFKDNNVFLYTEVISPTFTSNLARAVVTQLSYGTARDAHTHTCTRTDAIIKLSFNFVHLKLLTQSIIGFLLQEVEHYIEFCMILCGSQVIFVLANDNHFSQQTIVRLGRPQGSICPLLCSK